MKKIETAVAALVFLPLTALAQQMQIQKKMDTTVNKSPAISNARVIPISSMDQRKIYYWGNGQRSTATGREAGERNIKYARVFGDSAKVVKDPYKKE